MPSNDEKSEPRAAIGLFALNNNEEFLDADAVALHYEGLDGVRRSSVVAFSSRPDRIGEDSAEFAIELPQHDRFSLYIEVGPDRQEAPSRERFRTAAAKARVAMRCKRR